MEKVKKHKHPSFKSMLTMICVDLLLGIPILIFDISPTIYLPTLFLINVILLISLNKKK